MYREHDLHGRRKSDPQKVRIASRLRRETTMTLEWIASRLCMGAATHVASLRQRHNEKGLSSEETLFPHMIARLTALDMAQLEPLVSASQREGFGFLVRLRDEWVSGANRFSKPGEALFGMFDSGHLVGVGGINRQSDSTGRLRRFYVLPSHRRQGYGRRLLRHILSHAAKHFRLVVLHTTTESGDRFYRACGFMRIPDSSDPTHRVELPEAEHDAPPIAARPGSRFKA